ncbi:MULTISPECIES: hypothetical protein [unclassified Nostoc]|uniref:hypothetical protein n=1 Tax=unclassified Nostoc TaxID=2593658 RepID=UPI00260E5FB9|nr:hypothetical protein [Nostoc sp. S13]MDF5738679.1 hypothetical protein [Nostoc sp. S13]
MSQITDFINRLDNCPAGQKGWREFEKLCVEIIEFLFVPPLVRPIIQPRTYSGTNRRDAVFPNRNFDEKHGWGLLLRELEAIMVLFEFKNYELIDIGHEEVIQTENYLTEPMGKLAIMVCNKLPNDGAHIHRNNIYSRRRKVILFITKDHLKEMLFIKERGEDPCDLIVDLVERFYLQHE